MLPGVQPAEATEFAERLRRAIELDAGPGVREPAGMRITASLGVSSLTTETASGAALIDQADRALYRAKAEGRDRCVAGTAADAPVPADA